MRWKKRSNAKSHKIDRGTENNAKTFVEWNIKSKNSASNIEDKDGSHCECFIRPNRVLKNE